MNRLNVPRDPGREPDLLAVGRPAEPARRAERLRQRLVFAGKVDDGGEAPAVSEARMVDERDPPAVAREAQASEPCLSFVEDLADREFQSISPPDVAHDGQLLAVR